MINYMLLAVVHKYSLHGNIDQEYIIQTVELWNWWNRWSCYYN